MKAMESTEHQISSSLTIASKDQSKLSIQSHIKCAQDKTAALICISEKCTQKNVFQCSDEECRCQISHLNCNTGKLKPVISMINLKTNISVQIKQAITQMITKKIDKLSLLEESLCKQIDQGLANFQSLFEKEKNCELSASDAKTIWSIATSGMKQKSEMLEEINVYLKTFDESIQKSNTELRQKINKLTQKGNIPFKTICREIMEKSAIITSEQLSQALVEMFSKRIKSINHVFNASMNQFSLAKYYQVCGKLTDTVIVCKTNMDKIIGAYTPLVFDEEPYEQIEDPSGESFIFSLTDSQKFTLKSQANAIVRYSNKSAINFGEGQFYIGDKSNQVESCCAYVNKLNYQCPAYSVDDQAAYLKFHGNKYQVFQIKEWQVWKLQFTCS